MGSANEPNTLGLGSGWDHGCQRASPHWLFATRISNVQAMPPKPRAASANVNDRSKVDVREHLSLSSQLPKSSAQQWWLLEGKRQLPRMFTVALNYLMIPAISDLSERSLSSAGVISTKRSCIHWWWKCRKRVCWHRSLKWDRNCYPSSHSLILFTQLNIWVATPFLFSLSCSRSDLISGLCTAFPIGW